MEGKKDIPSFDDIIQAARERRKNEALANEIFGKGRRSNALETSKRKSITGPGASLASRVGVTKRSISANSRGSFTGKWDHDLHQRNVPRGPRPAQISRTTSTSRIERSSRMYDEINRDEAQDGRSNGHTDISIRGMAGPYTVIASNFAPGTTAADIEAVMTPVGGEMTSCRLVSSQPTVIAEMMFVERDGAENVVSMFNNKKADGRLLYVYLKNGPPHNFQAGRPAASKTAPKQERDLMDIDAEQVDRSQQRRQNGSRSDAQYQDGRYGFPEPRSTNSARDYGRGRANQGLFSDRMIDRNRSYQP